MSVAKKGNQLARYLLTGSDFVTTEYVPSSLLRDKTIKGSFLQNQDFRSRLTPRNCIDTICLQEDSSSVTIIISPQPFPGIPVNCLMYCLPECDTISPKVVSAVPRNSLSSGSTSHTSNLSFCTASKL